MPTLDEIIDQGRRINHHHPCARIVITAQAWSALAGELAAGRVTLLGLWGDTGTVHIATLDESTRSIAVFSCECPEGAFPSVGPVHPPAMRLERAIHSLYGLIPVGAPDMRPWLDLGFWGIEHPLGEGGSPQAPPSPYAFLPAEGEGLHQIPVGPIHAGIIEPGHFRFTANGETVVRLEQRLGYVHKGIESLMAGATIDKAARLAGRTSGDSTVAYGLAFAHAIEAALDVAVPPRARYLRSLMAELERLANHFGDIGAICNDASFAVMHAHCSILRERILRAADACFGHRLMMDRIVPGGVACDIASHGAAQVNDVFVEIRSRFPRLVALYDNTASLQDRTVSTGVVSPDLARRFGAGGFVGRASDRGLDARKTPGYPPYDQLDFQVPVLDAGNVNARVWIRIREVEESIALIGQVLARLPDGPIAGTVTTKSEQSEGLGFAESFRGDVLAWVRLEGDRIARCHLRDPSWFQWPLLEAAIEGNIVADFPLCNKSFNCSYSGHDL